MRITGEIEYNNALTDIQIENIIDVAASFIFRINGNGKAEYKPYYLTRGLYVGIALYGITGVEFDQDDIIYDEILKNEEIKDAVSKFIEYENIITINEYIINVAEFRKQEYLNKCEDDLKEKLSKSIENEIALQNLQIKIAKKQNTLLSQQIKQNEQNDKIMEHMNPEEIAELNKKFISGDYDMNKIAELVTDKYIQSELHKRNIIEIENAKHFDARNVLADDGK